MKKTTTSVSRSNASAVSHCLCLIFNVRFIVNNIFIFIDSVPVNRFFSNHLV